jgi:hypothetical protein
MKTDTITAAAFLVALLVVSAPAGRSQNLLINGSFESSAPPQSELRLTPGATNLPGWTLGVTGSLYVVRGPVFGSFAAVDGLQYADLNGRGLTLSQTFATVPGEIYECRFSLGRFQSSIAFRVQTAILADGGTVLTNFETAAPLTVGWLSPTRFRFVATTARSTIQFTDSTGTVNYDLTLDDVFVERSTPRLSIETSHIRVCWESQINRTYQLQYRSALTTNVWIDLGSPIAGIGAADCTVQPVSDPQRFYRIVRLP